MGPCATYYHKLLATKLANKTGDKHCNVVNY